MLTTTSFVSYYKDIETATNSDTSEHLLLCVTLNLRYMDTLLTCIDTGTTGLQQYILLFYLLGALKVAHWLEITNLDGYIFSEFSPHSWQHLVALVVPASQ